MKNNDNLKIKMTLAVLTMVLAKQRFIYYKCLTEKEEIVTTTKRNNNFRNESRAED